MSTQTEHLGLHQWESSDPFLREDFNEDNQTLDQAVHAAQTAAEAATAFVTLMDFVTEEGAQQVDLDVSELNLPQYSRVFLRMENASVSSGAVQVRLNNISDRVYDWSWETSSNKSNSFFQWSSGESGALGGCSAELFFLGGIIGARIFNIYGSTYEGTHRAALSGHALYGIPPQNLSAAELTSIQLFTASSQGIAAGFKIRMVGVRI